MNELPPWLRLLTTVAITGSDRDFVLGDISETYAVHAALDGKGSALMKVTGDVMSVVLANLTRTLRHDRRVHMLLLLGLTLGTGVIASLVLRFNPLVWFAAMMWLCAFAVQRYEVPALRSRFWLLLFSYAASLLPGLVWVLATVPEAARLREPALLLKWLAVAVPAVLLPGVLGSLAFGYLAAPRRKAALIIMAIPILASGVLALTTGQSSVARNVAQVVFPASTMGPASLQNWSGAVDLAIWVLVALAVGAWFNREHLSDPANA
jgi:hypothetical protein